MTSIEWVKNELSHTDDHLTTSDRIMLNKILKELERLEALKQHWQQEEWCEGIELSIESLDSLFKYNKDLFDKNLELDKKLASEFEDSADELCKALTERDKLQAENQDLKVFVDSYATARDKLLIRNQKLETAIEIIKKILGLEVKDGWQCNCGFYYYLDFIEWTYIDNKLTQEEFDLLKEVF